MNFFFFLPCPIVEKLFLLFVSRNEAKLFRKQIRVNLFYPRQSLCLHVLFFILFFLSYWTYTFAAVSRVILQFVGSNYDLLLCIRLLVHLCAAFCDSAYHWVHRQLTQIPSKQINLLKLCKHLWGASSKPVNCHQKYCTEFFLSAHFGVNC